MNSESVDLIYLDPPFNSKEDYSAPIGSEAAGAAFKDTWTLSDVDLLEHNRLKYHAKDKQKETLYALIYAAGKAHSKGMFSYLMMMAPRLIEMRRVLKPTGSIYLHCDPTASQYLKVVMDTVFGAPNFRNEVVWKRTGAHGRAKRWGPIHDVLLFYTASPRFTWNRTYQQHTEESAAPYSKEDEHGRFQSVALTGPGTRGGSSGLPWKGRDPTDIGRHWELPPDRSLPSWVVKPPDYAQMSCQERLDVLEGQGLIFWTAKEGALPRYKRYLEVSPGIPLQDIIADIPPLGKSSKEKVGYPTQKPIALLERIICASSNEGDLVLDPFCGCATTMVAAEMLNRQWVGIDLSPKAAELVVSRIQKKRNLFKFQDIRARTDLPIRTDVERRMVKDYSKEWHDLKAKLYDEQKGCCNFCHTYFRTGNLEMDHIFPKAKGGKNWVDNYQLLCSECNGVKSDEVSNEKARARIAARRGIDFSPFESGVVTPAYEHLEPAMLKVAEQSRPYGSKKRKPKT